VQEAFDAFHVHISKHFRRPEQVKRRLETDVMPYLGRKPVGKVTRTEVASVLQAIVDRGAPVAANRTLADVKHLWAFALERGWIDSNPLLPLTRKTVGGKETPRGRVLSWDEIEAFLAWMKLELQTSGAAQSPGTVAALYLCLLTGQRASEVLSFALPPAGEALTGPAKVGQYKVPLTPHVRAAMRRLGATPMPMDHRVLSRALRRRGFTFTPHDLRRTFSTRLADLGVMPHVIEKLLNHRMTGVMAVYNKAEYWPERRAAMRLWGVTLAALRLKKRPD
jgi:integrase